MDHGQKDVALRATEVPMLEPEIVRQIRGLDALNWGSKLIAATLGISRVARRPSWIGARRACERASTLMAETVDASLTTSRTSSAWKPRKYPGARSDDDASSWQRDLPDNVNHDAELR
jgi:hypothetical protein